MGTCPVCGITTALGKGGRKVLSHSVPRDVYKDGRGCPGVGRIAVEKSKTDNRSDRVKDQYQGIEPGSPTKHGPIYNAVGKRIGKWEAEPPHGL